MSAADSACYVAKDTGRNTVYTFLPDDIALAQHHGQMQWVQRLQRALDNDSFALYYQTIRPLNTYVDDKDHAELLIRLLDEEQRVVMPSEFLPAAERYHMMPQIDRWVIRQAFAYLSQHLDEYNQRFSTFAINLSGQSLGDETFLNYVMEQFRTTKMPYKRICFEITETAVIGNIMHAREFIQQLRKRGCQFSLDDFGSGLSSFSYLKSLAVDNLKIDGNFVQGILNDEDDYNMVMSINQIGHVMGIHTIAEFVESERVLQTVERIGVDFAQGYFIDKPTPLI
jgi:EAL domain-containing protein (putative c-di-GMP-specific phosphodiesterase class I)